MPQLKTLSWHARTAMLRNEQGAIQLHRQKGTKAIGRPAGGQIPRIGKSMADQVYVHLQPALRERANFIIGMRCGTATNQCEWEQLWAKKIGANRFEICCIPFVCYGLSLGDIVETSADIDCGREYMVSGVVTTSGNFTLRVFFLRECAEDMRLRIISELRFGGCVLEWYSEHLLGVSVHSEELLARTRDAMDVWRQQGVIVYETGWKGEKS